MPYKNSSENTMSTPKSFNEQLIRSYTLFLSLFFLASVPIAVLYTKEWDILYNLWDIVTSPSKLVTDYFALGGLGSTLLNVAICGLFANAIIYISGVRANAKTLAGYMLIIAHAFYGLNFINMWMPFLGVILFCIVMKKKISENIHIAFYATALSPFVSEVIFRYPIGTSVTSNINWIGIIIAIICGVAIGFVVLPLLPGTTSMHREYNLYKAGLAIGMMGIFIYAFMYNTLGITPSQNPPINNPEYYAMPYAYRGFMNIFYLVLFGITFIAGFLLKKGKIKDYKKLLKCTGYGTDFVDKFGMPMCFINIAIYGLLFLFYLNLVFVLPDIFPFLPKGVGLTAPTAGAILGALTFASDGQHPRNVAPIVVGYMGLQLIVIAICTASNLPIPWTLATQAYINGLAFATGLCPIAGKYGFKYGIIAGMLSAVICSVTSSMHGGFVLYNGGFTAGLTALIMIPLLDYYNIVPKREDDT